MDAHEDLAREIVAIGIADPQAAERRMDVGRVFVEHLSKERVARALHILGLGARRRIHQRKSNPARRLAPPQRKGSS